MNIKTCLALLLVFCILFPALAQNKPAAQNPPQTSDDKDDVVKITTNLVQVDVVVTKDGKPVTNLSANDFEIFEDGKRQTITSFSYISNVSKRAVAPATATTANDNSPSKPLNPNEARRIMAIVVDDLGLSAESIYQVKRQLRKFVAENLGPDDLVAIIRTGRQLGALQQFTNDKRLLNRAMDQFRWNSCSRVGINVLPTFGTTLPGEPGNLVMDVTLLRDGKNVQTRPQVPIVASNPDLSRLNVNGLLPLTTELEPGFYYLQIVVSDKDAKNKTAPVVQWADFEIEGSNTKN